MRIRPAAHLRTEIPLSGEHALVPTGFDGLVRLDDVGVPLLGAIGSGGDKPDPVVGALLRPGPGDTAPDFTLLTDTGESLTLSSLKGRSVVLFFY